LGGKQVQSNLFNPKLVNPEIQYFKVAVCVHFYCSALVLCSLFQNTIVQSCQWPKCFGWKRLTCMCTFRKDRVTSRHDEILVVRILIMTRRKYTVSFTKV
jgi:hypothetical protein